MAIALVQSQTGTATGANTSQPATWAGNTTTGNLIVVAVSVSVNTLNSVTSITDSQTNTYTRIRSTLYGSSAECELWYAINITGGTLPTVTVNHTVSSVAFTMREYSGLATVSPLDKGISAVATTGTAMSSGATAATTQADELVLGYMASGGTTSYTLGTGYGNLTQVSNSSVTSGLEYLTVSSTGAQTSTATLSLSGVWCMGVATFKTPAASAAHNLTLLGIGK